MMRAVFLSPALTEMTEAAMFYDAQVRGLGEAFLDTMAGPFRTFRNIRAAGLSSPEVYGVAWSAGFPMACSIARLQARS